MRQNQLLQYKIDTLFCCNLSPLGSICLFLSSPNVTIKKLQFELPVVFTIGPDVNQRGQDETHESDVDHGDALMKYAMLLADSAERNDGQDHVESIIKGIIECDAISVGANQWAYLSEAL